jgi:uncharacterized membrane protein
VRKAQPYLIGALFVAAGALHFVVPRPYEAIVPPYLPSPKVLVAISGACEILGGLGVVVPATRRFSGWGLVALLLAIFPANVYMAVDSERFRSLAPAWALIWWIYRSCIAVEE